MGKYEARMERWRPRSRTLKEVEKSLDRYPDIGKQELAALMRQFRGLSLVDKAVIMNDVRLSRKLTHFYRDQEPDLQAHRQRRSPCIFCCSSIIYWSGQGCVRRSRSAPLARSSALSISPR